MALVEGARLFGDEEDWQNRPGRFDENDGKELIAALSGSYGKIRVTNFCRPVYRSSRPVIAARTSFHFSHRVIGNMRPTVEAPRLRKGEVAIWPHGPGAKAKISAAGGRIQRSSGCGILSREAAECHPELVREFGGPAARAAFTLERNKNAVGKGAAARFQDYLARGGADEEADADGVDVAGEDGEAAGMTKPGQSTGRRDDLTRDAAGVLELTSIGGTAADRAAFWHAVDAAEQKGGRVQYRIVAELPHEVRVDLVRQVAEAFCQQFEQRSLPFYAVVHESEARAGSDSRNRHFHAIYYDRSSARGSDGWDFSMAKHVDTRAIGWISQLRQAWATACNHALAREEHLRRVGGQRETLLPQWGWGRMSPFPTLVDNWLVLPTPLGDDGEPQQPLLRRLDPRPYKAMGIPKIPCKHLGQLVTRLERRGVPTLLGVGNARLEQQWQLYDEPEWLHHRIAGRIRQRVDRTLADRGAECGRVVELVAPLRLASDEALRLAKEHAVGVIRWREAEADQRMDERAYARMHWATARQNDLNVGLRKRQERQRPTEGDAHRLGLIGLLSEILVDAQAAQAGITEEVNRHFKARGISGPNTLRDRLGESRLLMDGAAARFEQARLALELARADQRTKAAAELLPRLCERRVATVPAGDVEDHLAALRSAGAITEAGRQAMAMIDWVRYRQAREQAATRFDAAVDGLWAVASSVVGAPETVATEWARWRETVALLAGTEALSKRVGVPVRLERSKTSEAMAELLLSDLEFLPGLDRALRSPTFAEAAAAAVNLRCQQELEVAAAETVAYYRPDSVRFETADPAVKVVDGLRQYADSLALRLSELIGAAAGSSAGGPAPYRRHVPESSAPRSRLAQAHERLAALEELLPATRLWRVETALPYSARQYLEYARRPDLTPEARRAALATGQCADYRDRRQQAEAAVEAAVDQHCDAIGLPRGKGEGAAWRARWRAVTEAVAGTVTLRSHAGAPLPLLYSAPNATDQAREAVAEVLLGDLEFLPGLAAAIRLPTFAKAVSEVVTYQGLLVLELDRAVTADKLVPGALTFSQRDDGRLILETARDRIRELGGQVSKDPVAQVEEVLRRKQAAAEAERRQEVRRLAQEKRVKELAAIAARAEQERATAEAAKREQAAKRKKQKKRSRGRDR